MKSKKFLFGIVVVLLMVTSVLPGCNEGQPTELVIPSSLEPKEVLIEIANAGPLIQILLYFAGGWTVEDIHLNLYDMPGGALEEQFNEGFEASILESLYIKRDGKQAGFRDKLVSHIAILKYEDTESAERSFVNISQTQEFQNLTYDGITLKNGTHALDPWWWEEYDYWDEPNQPCYLIQSNCFVIYIYGREDVAKDILDRIIVAFGVSE